MGLATYRSCSFAEKRAVLRSFWAIRPDDSDKVNRAASEYGPYAFALVAVIAGELAVISVALLVAGTAWAWLGVTATLLAALCLRRTRQCRNARRWAGA